MNDRPRVFAEHGNKVPFHEKDSFPSRAYLCLLDMSEKLGNLGTMGNYQIQVSTEVKLEHYPLRLGVGAALELRWKLGQATQPQKGIIFKLC